MTWTPLRSDVWGDSDPWTRWIPLAWNATLDPRGRNLYPPPPDPTGTDPDWDHAMDVAAWWAAAVSSATSSAGSSPPRSMIPISDTSPRSEAPSADIAGRHKDGTF